VGRIKSLTPLRLLADGEKAYDFYINVFIEGLERNSGENHKKQKQIWKK